MTAQLPGPPTVLSPIAVVGVAAIMPEAPDVGAFWRNIREGRYCITDVPPGRWDPERYYDPDPAVPDKTYSRIGGWVREYPWEPMSWRLPIPPKVAEQMDVGQHWAVSGSRSALLDAGWPGWSVDPERVAVVFGNAIGGDKHYRTGLRINFPEFARDLEQSPSFAALPAEVRAAVLREWHDGFVAHELDITEDTMPGELSNVLAGRVANLFDFRGPNFTTDAACASGLAAMSAAVQGLATGQYDAAVTGGIDRNMGINGFVKFCKIGALSATGTRPFDAGADGFVMGEGAAVFVLKRLADAERDGDRVYAVLLGLGGSSDGKGKGITAPNPVGQRLAVERAWVNAGLKPASASAVEAHGTSTRVGDAAELASLADVFQGASAGSIALGSVKSNIGHLKAAAGSAGLVKMVLQLHHRELAPSLNFRDPNPNVDWDHIPFRVNTELREWPADPDGARRAGVSAFGFGGTNFHAVLEEYVPGLHRDEHAPRSFAVETPALASEPVGHDTAPASAEHAAVPSGVPEARAGVPQTPRPPLRGALLIGGRDDQDVVVQLQRLLVETEQDAGRFPGSAPTAPDPALARAAVRVAVDYADVADLAAKVRKTLKAFAAGQTPAARSLWKMLRAQGVFVGRGSAPQVAFLYTGQGSQYANMLEHLRDTEPIVAETFAEADRIMTPLLGRSLSSYVFVDTGDPAAVAQLEEDLRRTEITQPAVLTTDLALTRLLAAYGVRPDMVMGHSLGEYAALVAAGSLSFQAALEAVSARGHEMASLSLDDPGAMAAAFGPLEEIERVVDSIEGAVVANINSTSQAVVGGGTAAVERAVELLAAQGVTAARIPVSHAFHTSIVAPATEPLKAALRRLDLRPPERPIVANVTGEFYPPHAGLEAVLDLLGRQVASPVQFVRGLHTLHDAGARVFVEVGPKRALHGFVEDVLGDREDVLALFTNHPKNGDVPSFNAALCGLWAAGLGLAQPAPADVADPRSGPTGPATSPTTGVPMSNDTYLELGRMFAGVLEQGMELYADAHSEAGTAPAGAPSPAAPHVPGPVVITGAALGLPGVERVFDDENLQRILDGQQFIDTIPHRHRQQMVDLHITRLVKREAGDPTFEVIDDEAEVVKLAGRGAPVDVVEEFGVDPDRDAALDEVTRLAIGAGFDALRDAGIPLVMRYKTTTLGSQLPERWGLPDALRDDTGIVFASAFPGYDSFAEDLTRYYTHRGRREQLLALEAVRARMRPDDDATAEVDRRVAELRHLLEVEPFSFDRRFLFRCLSMGHSQFAEIIGARGPNTQLNAACASTTQALSLAEDWIRSGRCRRVVVVSADDVTSDVLLPWVTSGFLASGAAATDDSVETAATPFDRRRHGMIVGMGAAAFVVESADAAAERGLQPVCEVLGTVTANSAFHGTRLDVAHIAQVMEDVVAQAERRGIDRREIAGSTVFVSHETYTPARGGSAAAEINALRATFGDRAEDVVITNTKGFTGHAMGAGVEDVVAIKSLETGIVPPVPNYKEPDPELGPLNLSRGGAYPVRYALRLAAGFGSQIAMSLTRWTPVPDGRHRAPSELGYAYRIVDPQRWQRWLEEISGLPGATLEVVTRRLRVVDTGAPSAAPAGPASARATATPPVAPEAPSPVPAAPTTEPEAQREVDVPSVVQGTTEPAGTPAVAALAEDRGGVDAEPAAALAEDEVTRTVVSVVAELTGYPPELLDLDLDLEADLGVDTVKQAEVFAAVRTRFGIERDETLRLRDFPTLAHVIGWIHQRTDTATQPTAQPSTQPVPPEAQDALSTDAETGTDEITEAVVSTVSELTGYPPELLDLDLDLEADLGVDTVKQAEVFAAVRTRFGIERDETLRLRDFPTLAHVIGWIHQRTDTATQPTAQPSTQPVPPEAQDALSTDAETGTDEITEAVVSTVSELTGYPPELLDLDLDLEADLGVDTVKQAEVFAAVRTRFGIERDETLRLRDFPTLAHVIGWIHQRVPATDAPPTEPPVTEAATAAPEHVHPTTVVGDLDAVDRLPRRIPVPSLRPALEQCVPTGVTLEDARVVVMRDEGGVGDALVKRLGRAGVATLVLDPDVPTDELPGRLDAWTAEGNVTGVYWLAALDDEGAHDGLALAGWREAVRRRVKTLHATMRRLVADPDATPFLVTATRLGGFHGYDEAGATAPLGGLVTGFAKAYKRERPAALVKAVDFPPTRKTAALAELMVEETLRDPGCVEVGHEGGRRWSVALVEAPFPSQDSPLPGSARLDADSVVLVTGAAGGIVAAITADLAKAAGGTFHLLDLTPVPDPADPDLVAYLTDRDGLRSTLAARMREHGQRATPVAIEKQLARLERSAAALTAIDAVRDAGGTVHYHQVDLTDGDQVAAVLEEVRRTDGRIDLVLHAAGLDISRALADKEPTEFDLVLDVKVDGWFNLLHAAADLPIGALVAFSSVAGRFGNAGQTDYAAANDLLCKLTSSLRRTRPEVRALAIDWTAWAGIGMATRGSIPKIMEMAGVEMLTPETGVAWIRRELTAHPFRGEVVVAGALGLMAEGFHPTGGLDPAALPGGGTSPLIGEVVAADVQQGLTVRTVLDPTRQPFLDDHRIDGTPVLPGVMGMEAFAEVARLLVPDHHVVAVEDVDFSRPLKFYRDEPRTLTLTTVLQPAGAELLAHCRLRAERAVPGTAERQVTTHFTGSVRLSPQPSAAEQVRPVPTRHGHPVGREEVYRLYFHGPAYQVVGESWRDDGAAAGRLTDGLPPDRDPSQAPLLVCPRLAELCFQTAGVWEAGHEGRLALPAHLDRLEVLDEERVRAGTVEGAVALAWPARAPGSYDCEVVDPDGRVLLRMAGYRTVPLPGDLAEEIRTPLLAAMTEG